MDSRRLTYVVVRQRVGRLYIFVSVCVLWSKDEATCLVLFCMSQANAIVKFYLTGFYSLSKFVH